jgi:hypothetical protein
MIRATVFASASAAEGAAAGRHRDNREANAWLKDHYKAEHNRQFAIAPAEEGTAFVPDREGAWRDILCVVEERVVSNDNTVVARRRHRLQLPESRLRPRTL